jgi:hypothetical protein
LKYKFADNIKDSIKESVIGEEIGERKKGDDPNP